MADDVKPGKVSSFPQAVKLKKDEIVVFAWIVYKSHKDSDRIMELVMKDKRFANMDLKDMPSDGKRMFWGGFEVMIKA